MSALQSLLCAMTILPWVATSTGSSFPLYSYSNTTQLPPGWYLAGCDSSPESSWTLTSTSLLMTVEMCLNACQGASSLVAGIQERNCYCNGPPQNNISSSLCNVPCPGSPTETCGGPSLSGPPQKRQLDTNITDSYYIFNPIPLSNGTNSTGSDNSTGADGTGSGDPTQSDLGSPSTSTIYATEMITITSCAATITNCPLRNHTSAGQNPGSAVITTSTPISQVIFAPQVTTFTPCNTCEVTTTTTMLAYTTVPCPPTGTGIGGNQNSAGEATGAAKGNVSLPAGGGTPTPSSSGSGNAGVVASAGEMGVRMEVVWGLTVVGLAVLSFYC